MTCRPLFVAVAPLRQPINSFPNTSFRRPSPRCVPTCKLIRPQRHAADDWFRSLTSLPSSLILKRVLPRLVPNFLICTCTTAAYQTYTDLSDSHFGVSALPHTFLATLLSLVLVFRSDAAYSKFDEGRRLWGKLINLSRGMGRLVSVALPRHHARLVLSLLCCFCYSLKDHLYDRRQSDPYERFLKPLFLPSDLRVKPSYKAHGDGTVTVLEAMPASLVEPAEMAERINAAPNKPLEVVMQLGIAVRAAMNHKELVESRHNNGLPTMSVSVERQMMEDQMQQLLNILGGCERIVKTPVPQSWSRHTSRLLSIWALTLPAVLVPIEGWFCIPTVALISWAIFSIEEIAYIMEDPFLEQRYCLPLAAFCETIETDVLDQLMGGKPVL